MGGCSFIVGDIWIKGARTTESIYNEYTASVFLLPYLSTLLYGYLYNNFYTHTSSFLL